MSVATKGAVTSGSNTGIATVDVNLSTANVGDLMLVGIIVTGGTVTVATPAGWVAAGSGVINSRTAYFYYKRKTASDPATLTFTSSTTNAISWSMATIVGGEPDVTKLGRRVYANDVGTNFDWDKRYTYYLVLNSANTNDPTKSRTTRVRGIAAPAKSLVVTYFAEATTATETDASLPAVTGAEKWAFTGHVGTNINSHLWATEYVTTAKTTSDVVAVYQNDNNSNGAGLQIVIPELVDVPTTPTKFQTKLAIPGGGIETVGLTYFDGVQEQRISKLDYYYPGTTVSELLSMNRVFTMAHRGGSLDYQEHSERGYFEAKLRHADVIEFSVGITKDGKFFGIHDETPNRTSSSLGSTPVPNNSLTWAEYQALNQDLPNRRDTRFTTAKYMLLEDVLKYIGRGTLLVDPKVIGAANIPALIAVLQTIPDYQERVMGKYFHTGRSVLLPFQAAGMKVWSFAYETDVLRTDPNDATKKIPRLDTDTGSLQYNHTGMDFLGLEYSASQQAWDEILRIANGRKVIGHIVPDVAAADMAVSKGARGLQVSGLMNVSTKY